MGDNQYANQAHEEILLPPAPVPQPLAMTKPCPFCGSHNVVLVSPDDEARFPELFHYVGCGDCQMSGPLGAIPQHALDLWNNRIPGSLKDVAH